MSAIETPAANAQTLSLEQASGSSFYTAMRILPKTERDAMFSIYAFCRAVDDIADEEKLGTREERKAALVQWRDNIHAIYAGNASPALSVLADPIAHFGLREDDFMAIIDGMEMDLDEDIKAPAFATLDLYCDRVASAVGRLSVRIFGMEEKPGIDLAHHLGRALQFTNILRDIDEDAELGRLYLHKEGLLNAGISSDGSIPDIIADPRLDVACRELAEKAREHYRASERILSARQAGYLMPPRVMQMAYGQLLDKMAVAGWSPPRARVKLSKLKLLWLVARKGLFG